RACRLTPPWGCPRMNYGTSPILHGYPRNHGPMRPSAARRPAAVLLGLLVGAFAVLIGPAAPASAHAELVSSSPAAGSTVPTAPDEIVLTFSEPVRQVPGKSHVIGPDGSV